MFVYLKYIFTLYLVINYEIRSELIPKEDKTLELWKPETFELFKQKNSCYSFTKSVGSCITEKDCRLRNGTISGFCFSLFLICCQFINELKLNLNSECITNSNKSGVCLESNDCTQRSGVTDGYCGSGPIVCCRLNANCGQIVKDNETQFVNNRYPFVTFESNVCQIVIERQSNVCQLRLELIEFQLSEPDITGQCTTDAFIVKTEIGEQLPIICGQNNRQHLYVEMGRKKRKNVIISVVTNGNNYGRKWTIKIVMISCDSLEMAPNGCLQYFQLPSALVQSFNFGPQIRNRARYLSGLRYTVCVRVEQNHCRIKWETEYKDSFSWGLPLIANISLRVGASGSHCSEDDFITIDEGVAEDYVPEDDRICGNRFLKYNYIISEAKPFRLRIRSNANHVFNSQNSQIGFSLLYTQLSCF